MVKAATTTREIVRTARRNATAGRRMVRLSDQIAARYDAAQTNSENQNHWGATDALSARAAHSPSVRRILRVRARYEVANSPLAQSIVKRKADFVVGTGPRLQIKTRDREFNRFVEAEFIRWSIATRFARKLWQMCFCKPMNGEALAIFFTNPSLRHRVKLDLRTIETDQLANPRAGFDDNGSDGVIFDDFGNPAGYTILRQHPGDLFMRGLMPNDYDTYRADDVLHWFDADRPGQIRGVPQITPSLGLFAMRRRYLNAVVAAAETAADLAVLLKTQAPPETDDNAAAAEPFDLLDIVQRQMMVLPEGMDATAFKGDQPQTTLDMFDAVLIREIARCMNMPYGIAAGDSSSYNFASGKLDHLPWFKTVAIEQDAIEDTIANPTFDRWYAEARRISGYLPMSLTGDDETPPHQWFWDGQDLLDPREAGAKATGLSSGFETHGRLFARRGEDPIEQWEAEAELLGISLDEYREKVIAQVFTKSGDSTQAPADSPANPEDSPDANQ